MALGTNPGEPSPATQSRNVESGSEGVRSSGRRAFVVLGMHRSGTSAMARVLALSGAALPAHILQPQPDNPTGFWEPKELVELNDKFLNSADSAWDDVFGYDLRATTGLVNEHNQTIALTALNRNYAAAPLIVMKDPRTSLLVPLWDRVLKRGGYDPVYVIMVRNPREVAESLRRRNNFAHNKSLMLWASYMLAAERDTRGSARVFVNYDVLASRPRNILDRIEHHTNVQIPRRTRLAANAIEKFVDTDLHHHKFHRDELDLRPDVWSVVTELYNWFDSASKSAEPLPSSEALAHAHRRMDDVLAAVGGVVADLRAEANHAAALVAEANRKCGAISSQAEQSQVAWTNALGQWRRERSALADRLSAGERALDELRTEQRRLEDELNVSRCAYDILEVKLQESAAAASLEALGRLAAEEKIKLAEHEIRISEQEVRLARQEIDLAREKIDFILQSRSWTVTKPLRAAMRLARRYIWSRERGG